ncbi:MAG TPA: tRNA 2-thiouridine(34) synthase MnmA, partial [Alphaproteobacteria bacterium]|nr:tRNA 2-thiouridine(34) synthase MnmA [Alphaproteobacteria bacterium]
MAKELNLQVAEKPDSQDICFVPTGNYSNIVEKLRPGAITPGEIRHVDGRVLGEHQGIIHFTVGQRRGIGIALGDGEPLYVIKLIPDKAQVIVGPKSALAVAGMTVRDINWLGDNDLPANGQSLMVKVRSVSQPVGAIIYPLPNDQARIVFDQPHLGV